MIGARGPGFRLPPRGESKLAYFIKGILGQKRQDALGTHYSILPLFQHSSCERSEQSSKGGSCRRDLDSHVRTPKLAQATGIAVLQTFDRSLVMFVEFENILGAEGDTNSTSLAPIPIDLNVPGLLGPLFS